MELRNIQTFIRVAECRNFTQAAQELGYVQSTVTMQIQQLERELGYPLFDRIGKTVSLTAMGEAFLSCAYEMERVAQKAAALGKEPRVMEGTLRVGVLESLLYARVLDVLPQFKAKFPALDLQLKMGQATELLQQLKQNSLDMIYISAGLNTDADLCCLSRKQESIAFFAGAEHPAAKQGRLSLRQIFGFDFVVTERSGICYGKLRQLAAEQEMPLRAPVEVDSTVAIAELLGKNMGLAFLPEYAMEKYLRQDSLVRLDVAAEPQIYYSQILCHKKRWVSPFMAELIQILTGKI